MDSERAKTVSDIREIIIRKYSPDVIVLFGSLARGDYDDLSDVDMLLIMDAEKSEKTADQISRDTDRVTRDKHIMIRSSAEYCLHRDIPGTVVYSAFSEGEVLYKKESFSLEQVDPRPYEERKYEVIEKDFKEHAYYFLAEAEADLKYNRKYRCRDNLKLAVARALKGGYVLKDIIPPRYTDLEKLYSGLVDLIPEMKKISPLIEELNNYYPEKNDRTETEKCIELYKKAGHTVDYISSLLFPFSF